MPIPTWSVGQVLAAADVNNWFVPLAAYKSVDQSVTSSTTLVNDSALALPVAAANAVYLFQCMLKYEGGTRGSSDLKFAFTGPAAFSMNYTELMLNTSNTGTTGFLRAAAGDVAGTGGAGNVYGVLLHGTVAVSSTTGTLQLQWAQNTSSATATIVHAGSVMAMWRIS